MAYVDQNMGKERTVAAIITAAILIVVGYMFYTGLAFNVIKKAAQDLNVIDIKDQPPPPPKQPPPPPKVEKQVSPPIVAPPPLVQPPQISPPQIVTVPVAPPAPPVIHPTAPPAPPAPPAKPSEATGAKLRGPADFGINDDDYPPDAVRAEQQGSTVAAWDIDTTGRVQNCHVTSSSGSSSLDTATCTLITRRARYTPAKDAAGNPLTSHATRSIRWVLPKD